MEATPTLCVRIMRMRIYAPERAPKCDAGIHNYLGVKGFLHCLKDNHHQGKDHVI